MMDGEKRIVTFMGESGRRTASIIWRDRMKMFEVFCEDTQHKESSFFNVEGEAQAFAEKFVWEKKYGNV
jgi:hypothetical protein